MRKTGRVEKIDQVFKINIVEVFKFLALKCRQWLNSIISPRQISQNCNFFEYMVYHLKQNDKHNQFSGR